MADGGIFGRNGLIPNHRWLIVLAFLTVGPFLNALAAEAAQVQAQTLNLQALVSEALEKNPEIQASKHKTSAAERRIPQEKAFPDPMVSVGYQNEGFKKYTYGQSSDAQWMFSASQTLPVAGKRALKGERAVKESDSSRADFDALRLKTISRVKELYFDLFGAHKEIDLLQQRTALFARLESLALARYSAGKGPQQDVIMAQTEKYMILEKEAMIRQRIQSLEAMLNTVLGREENLPLGKPAEVPPTKLVYSQEELVKIAQEKSPELESKEKMVGAAEAGASLAQKDYYPDVTVSGSYFSRRGDFEDMWSLSASVNLPIFYKSKQEQAVEEAKARLASARSEKDATRLDIASAIKDNYAMVQSADKLMSLYKTGLIPKSRQDIDLTLSGYRTGDMDALTVMSKFKSIIDFEISYWGQFTQREKAVARIEAITGLSRLSAPPSAGNKK